MIPTRMMVETKSWILRAVSTSESWLTELQKMAMMLVKRQMMIPKAIKSRG